MKKFIKENWFKILLIIAVFLYLIILGYGEYRKTKEHNLNVIAQMRLCTTNFSDFSNAKELRESCADRAKKQVIFGF